MSRLTDTIKPPFYAAVLNDMTTDDREYSDQFFPSDEMISIAPAQPGFLGLETSDTGTGTYVCYWRDMAALKAWEERGDYEIRKRFSGAGLKETCALQVKKVGKFSNFGRGLHVPASNTMSGFIAVLLTALLQSSAVLAEVFEHVAPIA